MSAGSIHCANDLEVDQSLRVRRMVKRVRGQLAKTQENGNPSTRRHLLTTSVRLNRTMTRSPHRMADHCAERLEIETPLELYPYNSPQFNAACFKPEDGRVFIMFSSSLPQACENDELLFVMRHELGHHVYKHHDIPIDYLLVERHPNLPLRRHPGLRTFL